MDDKAQMNVLEVVLVAGMLLMALYFVRTMDVSSHTVVNEENSFERISKGVLKSLAENPDQYDICDSQLAYYITYDYTGFSNYVKSVFPLGTMFRILKINHSKLFSNASASLDDCTTMIYSSGTFWFEDDARVTRIVSVNGYVYEIVLSVWFNLRG